MRFIKYSALENKYNKNNELILWDYINTKMYTNNNKKEIYAESIYKNLSLYF